MKKLTKVLWQVLVVALILGFASLALTGCEDLLGKDEPVTTTVSVTGVALNEKAVVLLVGGTETLTATVSPSNAANKAVSWSSSNSAVAIVSSTGLVSGITVGKATISVTTIDGGKTDTCAVEVSAGSATDATPITSAEIIVIAPAIGAVPNPMATGAGNFSVSAVSWSPSPDKFLADTVYTISVLLTANAGYTFTGLSSAKINGEDAVIANNIGSAVSVSYAFPATAEVAVPDRIISDRFVAKASVDAGQLKYSYTFDGYDFYYFYLGQMANIPLYSFDHQQYSAGNFEYSATVKKEERTKYEKAVTESSQTAIKKVEENTTSTKQNLNVSLELNAKYSGVFFSASAKQKTEYNWENYVKSIVINSSEYTRSLSNTVVEGTEFATSNEFTRTFKWGANDFPYGHYRYTMFGVSDVYLYVIRDPVTNEIVSYQFTEHTVPGLHSWDMEYTAALPFEKKDASGFVFDITLLDNLPKTKDRFNTFIVTNADEWNRALDLVKRGGSGTAAKPNDYTVTVSGNVAVTGGTDNTFGGVANIALTLNGNGKLYLNGRGSLLNIDGAQSVCIDGAGLALQGLKSGQNGALVNNNRTIISVSSTGKLELKDGSVNGNFTTTNAGAVHVFNGGTFTMNGGSISGNQASTGTTGSLGYGGCVYVDGGTFTMNGGTISDNNAIRGGGVEATNKSTFTMVSGTISGNTASGNGGGVEISSNSAFTMAGGTITGNEALINSGGIEISVNSTFTMNGGIISKNTATSNGGGVLLNNGSTFIMNGGVIGTLNEGNKANFGGGVYVDTGCTFAMTNGTISENKSPDGGGGGVLNRGSFNMTGGIISKNIANYGGGVYVFGTSFTKTGGTITGNNDTENANKANWGQGTYQGNAVWVETGASITPINVRARKKEVTSGQSNNLNAANNTNWDNYLMFYTWY